MRRGRGFTRREFIVSSAAVAGGAMLLGRHGLAAAASDSSVATDTYNLTVGYSERTLGGLKIRTRTYNGSLPGPLMVTAPGHHLHVTINNQLPPNPSAPLPPGVDAQNNPNSFNTTNLHVHGLQVMPHLFSPLGTTDPKALLIAIEPGQSFSYDFQLPPDHPSGLYWYHPHYHGSATVQVGGGMAGLILVKGPIDEVPEIKAARDELMAIENIKVNPGKNGAWEWEPIAYQPPANGGYSFTTALELLTVNGQPVMTIDRRGKTPVATPGSLASYRMNPGEVMRLRILNGTDGIPMQLVLPGFEVYLIGMDGVNFAKPERGAADMSSAIWMAPGNRAELLIRAPAQPASGTLQALARMASAPNVLGESMGEMMAMPQIQLANFIVDGAPQDMQIPQDLPLPSREYPLITGDDIVNRRTITFTMRTGSKSILTGFEFLLDGRLYAEKRVDQRVKLGTAEEWTLKNASDGIHPFHMHVNSFEVLGTPWDPQYHRFHDTIWLPPFSETRMRVRYKEWRGKSVYHCHILPHEDTAMIANFLIY
jgi:suppressor of ftsI